MPSATQQGGVMRAVKKKISKSSKQQNKQLIEALLSDNDVEEMTYPPVGWQLLIQVASFTSVMISIPFSMQWNLKFENI